MLLLQTKMQQGDAIIARKDTGLVCSSNDNKICPKLVAVSRLLPLKGKPCAVEINQYPCDETIARDEPPYAMFADLTGVCVENSDNLLVRQMRHLSHRLAI